MLELGQPNHTYDLAKLPGGALRVRWARAGETHHHPRRRRAHPHRRPRRRDRRRHRHRGRHRRGHGRRLHRDLRHHHRRAARVRLVDPHGHRRELQAPRPALRGLGPVRAGHRPRGRRPGRPAPGRAAGPVGRPPGRGHGHRRRRPPRPRPGHGAHRPGQPPARHRPRARGRCRRCSSPSASASSAADGAGTFSVTVPTFRPRHHHRDRRDRGDRPPPRLQPHPQAGAHRPCRSGRSRRCQRDRRTHPPGAGRAWACTRPCRCRSSPRATSPAPACPAEAVTLTNPLAAEESVLRTSLRPGLLRAVAYNESHRTEGVALFEIGKVFGVPLAGTTLPDEREHLAVVLAGAEATAAVEVWEVLHHTLGLPGAGIDQSPGRRRPAPRPLRACSPSTARSSARSARSTPACSTPWASASGSPGCRSTSAPPLALPHGEHPYRSISRYPSSDLDLAFEVDEAVPAGDVAAAIRGAAGELLVDLAPVRRVPGRPGARRPPQPGLPAAPPGHRPHPHRRRHHLGPRRGGHRRRGHPRRHPPRLSHLSSRELVVDLPRRSPVLPKLVGRSEDYAPASRPQPVRG